MSIAAYSYLFGRFRLRVDELNQMTLFSDGRAVALSTVELTVLRVLLENHGRFVTTESLLKSVSKASRATENIVHGAVRVLRRTLHDADLIRTERTKGYCFTGDVERRDGPDPTPDKRRDPFVVVALLVSAAVLLLPFGLAFASGSWESVTKQLGFIQALVILLAIGYDVFFSVDRDAGHADTETGRALIAVQQLRRAWRLLLASWCGLYVTLVFSEWFAPQASSSQWLPVVNTFLNNSSALMLVLCYLVLNRPTVIRVAGRDIESVPLKWGLFLVGGFSLIEAVLLAVSGRFGAAYTGGLLFGADLFSGVIGGIAMALCISRLDSRLLGTSGLLPVVPIVLYLYVVIQPFYPLVNRTFPCRPELQQHFDLWIIHLAFMLKSVMYIYVTELFRSERFLFYMIHARRVYENVETEWTGFRAKSS